MQQVGPRPAVRAVVKEMEELLCLDPVFGMLLWLQWLNPAGSLGGEAGAIISLLWSLGGSTGPGPGPF